MRLRFVSAAAAVATVGAVLLTAAPAQAVPTWPCFNAAGTSYDSLTCLWYNSGQQGSSTAFLFNGGVDASEGTGTSNVPNLLPYTFEGSGAGQNQSVKNHAATASNTYSTAAVKTNIWYNSNYAGNVYQLLPGDHPYRLGNNLYNQDASLSWSY
ncbi:hypothetical protein [Actinacidiphila rubida]|uniref:Peptidase inhibitor family I36 n=1 Tax=Actinacidiphila rubida TaxID=310780 RepID=A0A1H8EDR8_9ACTN|nr:hypothetical protein [Actinacidiphila rubida]SEN17669.1 hypothetical protein SAMN05216267_1002152 [Actinacidiphila rubida]